MSQYILALDQGTTSSRAILFDANGLPVGVAQQEFKQHYPQAGWVEHDPRDIWNSQLHVAQQVLKEANLSAKDVAGIGITNQRETTLIWDRKTGQPIHNAIVWQCRRTADMCAGLKSEGFEPIVREHTGLVIDAYFSGTKVAWLLDHVEGARARAEAGELAFGTVDSWLIWNLTGGALHITDTTNASRTMLYNIHTGAWDEEILAKLNIPAALLPEVRPSSGVYGEATVFDAPIPIAGIAGDQQAATFGQICYTPGMAKNTYGTGCFMLLNTGAEAPTSQNGLITTIAWQVGTTQPRVYALEGSIFIAGAAVQWLRDELGMIKHSSDVGPLAASVPDSDGVFFVPAFVGLGAPHWDSSARGLLIGLTRGSNRGHIARAVLESIAYQTADVLDAMKADSGLKLETLRVDGGASRNDLLMQIQADVLGVPVERPKVAETTALGAAYLAGLAVGYWPSVEALAQQWVLDKRFEPSITDGQRAERLGRWRQAVERSKGWVG